MRIFPAIVPVPSPPLIVDKYGSPIPVKPVIAPAPWAAESSDRNSIAEADPAASIKSGPRCEKNDPRVVVGHNHVTGIYGHNRDVRSTANNNLAIAPQVPVVTSLSPLPLYSFHHILLLSEESVAEVVRPIHVGGHHLQHGRKRQQRLDTRIPRELVALDCVGQGLAMQ